MRYSARILWTGRRRVRERCLLAYDFLRGGHCVPVLEVLAPYRVGYTYATLPDMFTSATPHYKYVCMSLF